MKEELLLEAMSGINAGHIRETGEKLDYYKSHTNSHKKLWRTLLIAAIITTLLTITAYAYGWFGLRAIKINSDELKPYKYEKNEDGKAVQVENKDGAFVSISQPQDVPDEIPEEIKKKIDNSVLAWEEWDMWRKENSIEIPENCKAPEGTDSADTEENGDGTLTVTYYGANNSVIEKRTVTDEEWDMYLSYINLKARGGINGYDYTYHVYTTEAANKLEEIASKYSLKLRHDPISLYQNLDSYDQGLSLENMTEKANDLFGSGHFFNENPKAYDKIYYYDEGTFCISFYTTDEMHNGPTCYLYNSPYETLSSGMEVFTQINNAGKIQERYYTAKDGTKLTVITADSYIFAFSYLKNSFVNMQLYTGGRQLSEEEINSIIDMVNYSSIN